jgi:ribosome-associated protein
MSEHLSTEQLVKIAIAALEDIKGKDITVLDVSKLTSLFDSMIVASGDSTRQVKSLADNVQKKLKEAGAEIIGMEGEQVGEWVLVDAGNVVIHVMHPTVRLHYNLEELWGAARKARSQHH